MKFFFLMTCSMLIGSASFANIATSTGPQHVLCDKNSFEVKQLDSKSAAISKTGLSTFSLSLPESIVSLYLGLTGSSIEGNTFASDLVQSNEGVLFSIEVVIANRAGRVELVSLGVVNYDNSKRPIESKFCVFNQ